MVDLRSRLCFDLELSLLAPIRVDEGEVHSVLELFRPFLSQNLALIEVFLKRPRKQGLLSEIVFLKAIVRLEEILVLSVSSPHF
jgi:hypothetical protein